MGVGFLARPLDYIECLFISAAQEPRESPLERNLIHSVESALAHVERRLSQGLSRWLVVAVNDQPGLDQLDDKSRSALFRNLSTAEVKAGRLLVALQLRRNWMVKCPNAVPIKRALQWAQQGLQSGESDPTIQKEALQLLKDLKSAHPENKEVTQALADGLEATGDYREAALLYRELLK